MLQTRPRLAPWTVAAFAAVYLIWGSTYAAIRLALETFPPFLMGAFRFGAAGVLLYGVLRMAGHARPSARQWGGALTTGVLMFLGGSGMVGWAEQTVDSGLASALIATVPLWVVVLDWLVFRGPRPGGWQAIGLLMGLGGVWLLVAPEAGVDRLDPRALVLVLAACCWSAGSLLSRRASLPSSPFMTAAMQMIVGGVALTALGVAAGEAGQLRVPTTRACLALGYLTGIGAVVGLCAYLHLLRTVRPAAAATYAFVNPVIALALGHLWLGEPLTQRMGLGVALVVLSVVLIIGRGLIRRRPPLALIQPSAPGGLQNKTRSAA